MATLRREELINGYVLPYDPPSGSPLLIAILELLLGDTGFFCLYSSITTAPKLHAH